MTQHAQASQSHWPEIRATLGKPLVLQRRGHELNTPRNPWKIEFSKRGVAKSDTRAAAHRYRASDGSRIPVIAFGTALFERKRSRHILPLLSVFSTLNSLAAKRLAKFSNTKVHKVVARSRAEKHRISISCFLV